MTSPSELTHEQELLRDYMSELSETYYCAGWLMGLEFSLWAALDGKANFAGSPLDREEIEKLKQLSEKCGGWIYWDETPMTRNGLTGESGESFISLDDWKAMVKVAGLP